MIASTCVLCVLHASITFDRFFLLCRFLDLPDEVKGSLPMNKENFAYILGWSDENLTGKAYSIMCNPCVSV